MWSAIEYDHNYVSMLLLLYENKWLRVCLARNWVPLLTLTPMWLLSLFLLTGCVWRILTCHCTSTWSQLTAIEEALFQHLLSTTPSTCSRALLSALPHATTLEWVFTFRTKSFALAYILLTWNASTLLLLYNFCPECHNRADPFGNQQVGCGGNGDRITMRNVIFIVLPNLLPWLLLRRCPT